MELKEIKELIRLVSESGVSEVEVERGDFKVSIKKTAEKTTIIQASPVLQNTPVALPPNASSTGSPQYVPVEKMEAQVSTPIASNLITIKSPMIGTFYKTPSPDKPPF